MAKIILITGGSRSGKSIYAQKTAESIPGNRIYIATCPPLDEEIKERIRKHQEARSDRWTTIEETTDLAGALARTRKDSVILVDCLTLWINNLLYEAETSGSGIGEPDIARCCREILDICTGLPGTVIFVTNEIGMGIVPADATSRLFRDLAGRCNQVMAQRADTVILMISGIPITIKGEKTDVSS